jgi:hypothetical protein
MNRREVLRSVSVMLGGAFSAPTLLAMDRRSQCGLEDGFVSGSEPSPSQLQIVAEVAEIIVPQTDTPGAIAAGVPAFIVMMLKDCYRQPEQESFIEGLRELESSRFLSLDQGNKESMIRELEARTVELMKAYQVQQTKMGDNEDREQMKQIAKGLPFWRLMKELTLLGYFTSEQGIKASFDYVPIPGKLELIKLKPGQKAYAY